MQSGKQDRLKILSPLDFNKNHSEIWQNMKDKIKQQPLVYPVLDIGWYMHDKSE